MSPDEALRLSLNQPADTAEVPLLDEFTVTAKPLPVWPLAIFAGLLLLAVVKE